jgi:hypothetical protein
LSTGPGSAASCAQRGIGGGNIAAKAVAAIAETTHTRQSGALRHRRPAADTCLAASQQGRKAFFSEEKKQKTFILSNSHDRGNGPHLSAGARNKSLFASFSSEKEDSSFRISL